MQICGNSKYELAGLNNDVILIPLSFENLPAEIKVNGETLYTPNRRHVSLLYIGLTIKKYNILIPNFLDKIVGDFCEFAKENKVEIIKYKDEYRLVSADGIQKSVVVMCELSNLNKFFDFINQKYKLNIKYPTPHVTMYNTEKGKPGRWLMDEEDLETFTKIIENPIGKNLV